MTGAHALVPGFARQSERIEALPTTALSGAALEP
jgi:hypothetical protein